MKMEALLFGGPMDGQTLVLSGPTEFINVPMAKRVGRDEIGRFESEISEGHYVYDRERSNHNLNSVGYNGPFESCYRWVE